MLDSIYRGDLISVLPRLAAPEASAELSYVRGIVAAEAGDRAAATEWLTRAHTLTSDDGNPALSARIGLELGLLYLDSGEREAADTVLAQLEARSSDSAPCADQLLLRGLLYRDIGDHRSAQPLFREALVRSRHALTPQTQVLALVNLAVGLEHSLPGEAVALCQLASATVEQEQLDRRWHPRIWNIEGYAQLCRGALSEARASLTRAMTEARSRAVPVYERRAQFNLAIVDELEGAAECAELRLADLERLLTADPSSQLRTWVAIRGAWIALGRSDLTPAYRLLGAPDRKARCYWEAIDTLRACVAVVEGELDLAENLLRGLVSGYRQREDHLITMVLLLWRAHIARSAGRMVRARAFLVESWEIGIRHGFLAAPSWWTSNLVETARSLSAGTPMAAWTASLVSPARSSDRQLRSVAISLAGDVVVSGLTFDGGRWRHNGTGSRVLRRYLGLLAAVYPERIGRDRLADTLWPDSDGDRAVNNLYAATSDLRRVLREVDGVSLICDRSGYGLDLDANVRVGSPAPGANPAAGISAAIAYVGSSQSEDRVAERLDPAVRASVSLPSAKAG